MAREKHVNPMTVEEKQAIINDSVQTLSNQPVMSGEDLKKRLVSPIVNVDGKANIGAVIDRIAYEAEAALNEIDGIASGAAQKAETTKTNLEQHVTAYNEHVENYNAFTEEQKEKDQKQDSEIKRLQDDKQDNLAIDGGYSETNPVATVQTVDNKILPITQDIPLLGATLSMDVDPLTYKLTLQLKNKSGEVVSTVTNDLPIEEMVVDAHLGEDEQTIVLELRNGNTVSFSVAALVDGLISKEAFDEALVLQKSDYDEKISKKADKLSGVNVLLGTDEKGNQKEYPVSSVGTNVTVGGERVETFDADTKVDVVAYSADKETTAAAINERVKTETVGVAGGVAGLDGQGKVPKEQLPTSSMGLELGETYDTAFAGDRGAKLEKRVDTLYSFHEEKGDMIVTPIATPFNTRTTADGANVVDGSLAVVKMVGGGTKAIGKDENGLNGTLVHASFKGIESKDANGDFISKIEFENALFTPLGVTIDFENKKITDYGVKVVLGRQEGNTIFADSYNGNSLIQTKTLTWSYQTSTDEVYSSQILPNKKANAFGFCSDALVQYGEMVLGKGSTPDRLYWVGIMTKLGLATTALFNEWLAQRYTDGNPVTVQFISSELQSETPFTDAQLYVGDNYTVSPQGTETVLGNDTEAENEPTIEYVIKAGA